MFTVDENFWEKLEARMQKVLAESGLIRGTLSKHEAGKLLSRRLIEKGISSGELPTIQDGKRDRISLSDLNDYKERLMRQNKNRIKFNK